jgi:hypothetical protein
MKRWLILISFLFIFQIVSAQDYEDPSAWVLLHTIDGWQAFGEITSICTNQTASQHDCTEPAASLPVRVYTLSVDGVIRLTLNRVSPTEALALQLLDSDSGSVVAQDTLAIEREMDVEWQPEVPAGHYELIVDVTANDSTRTVTFLYHVHIPTHAEVEDFFPHPPPLLLQTDDDQWVQALYGGYCFPPDEDAMGCVEVFAMPMPEAYVAVPMGNNIRLRLGALPYPESVSFDLFSREAGDERINSHSDYDLTLEPLEFTWSPDVVAGDYVLHVHVQWSDISSVDYVFGVTLAEPIYSIPDPPQFSLWTADNIIVGGEQGSYCWQDGTGSLCRDFMFAIPEVYHPLIEGNFLYVVVQTNNFPEHVYVSFYANDMSAQLFASEMAAPEPGIYTLSVEDLPEGDYIVIISGVWEEGDASNVFGVHIEP